ncbi:serine/threonine protein kinase [Actinokineospora sp. PR83]|uniref:serine/threonine-protein kinase n=1 Tax=Actinokineospora sp. PR83 TaxID=2884908 RepID=UPI001F18020E|nr:serine/threonine-protein kinase [Actinokineospora sp. PR83]MCG8918862.1 serine/threonine protein kinase [Actinokineospora sp. PR83]
MKSEDRLIAGRYRLSKQLGAGGMGVVWQAYDERLHRTVAVKQLLVPASLTAPEVEEVNRRAMREGRIAAKLQHPSSITVFDVVEDGGAPYLVLEYVPSTNLSVVLREQKTLPLDEVANIGAQVAAALAAAHEVGVVHRDVKPGNLLLGHDDTVKITDFGISRLVEDVTGTTTTNIAGTPAYLSPEVAQGKAATFASDVFSLGATLYTAIEGVSPFGANDNTMATLHRAASGQIDPPRNSGPMTDLLLAMLATDPAARPTMAEVRRVLAERDWASAEVPTQVATPLRTEKFGAAAEAPAPSAPPPATAALPVVPPPAQRPDPEPGDPDRKRKAALLVGATALVVVLAVAIVLVTLNRDSEQDPVAAPNTTVSTVTGPPGTSAAPPAGNEPPTEPPAPSSTPETTTPPPTTTTQPPPTTAPPPAGAEDTPEARVAAITGYYAGLPGGTDQNWGRLTAGYQQKTAGGLSGYKRFWSGFRAVSVGNVVASGPNQVDATITYTRTNGATSTERTRFTMVAEDGIWKIGGSSVIGNA